MLDKAIADDLRAMLYKECPADTYALKMSISSVQVMPNNKGYTITIGNADNSINGTATNQYASKLNFEHGLHYRSTHNRGKETYHWINKVVKDWAIKHSLQLAFNPDASEEEEQ